MNKITQETDLDAIPVDLPGVMPPDDHMTPAALQDSRTITTRRIIVFLLNLDGHRGIHARLECFWGIKNLDQYRVLANRAAHPTTRFRVLIDLGHNSGQCHVIECINFDGAGHAYANLGNGLFVDQGFDFHLLRIR